MAKNNRKPLGVIELEDGDKEIFPMADLFLTYTFENQSNWKLLQSICNILLDSCRKLKPSIDIELIGDDVKIITQYKRLVSANTKKAKQQDIKIIEQKDSKIADSIKSADDVQTTYVEFQNEVNIKPPIEIRAVEYFGLSLGNSKGNRANQVWVLAKDLDSVLHGEIFTYYVLKDVVTGASYPNKSGIMFISLQKLSQDRRSSAGELAAFLIGENVMPKNKDVKDIVDGFKSSFETFREQQEVIDMLTLTQRARYEGEVIGEARGELKAKVELYYMELNLNISEIAIKLNISEDEVKQILEEKGVAYSA